MTPLAMARSDSRPASRQPEILVISFSPLHRDPRVRRQIQALAGDYGVHAAGLSDPRWPGVSFTPLRPHSANRFWLPIHTLLLCLRAYTRTDALLPCIQHAYAVLAPLAKNSRVIIANDIESLPLALRLGRHCRVLYDAHEYAPGQYRETWLWLLLIQPYRVWVCRTFMPLAFRCVTVNALIAEAYRELCGVTCSISVNAPDRYTLQPQPTDPHRIRLIHHGGAAPRRQLEKLIAMVSLLDERFSLTLMLVAPPRSSYLRKLRRLAARQGRTEIVPPVDFDAIVPTLNAYDIGVSLLPPVTINQKLALPNKLFEFIQARLAVATSPNPAMADLVERHRVGVVSEAYTPAALASVLNRLSADQIDAMKQNSHVAADHLHSGIVISDWQTWVHEALTA